MFFKKVTFLKNRTPSLFPSIFSSGASDAASFGSAVLDRRVFAMTPPTIQIKEAMSWQKFIVAINCLRWLFLIT